jgi:hypothetical protein
MQQIERTASIDDQGQIHLEFPEAESDEAVIAGLRQSLQDFREGNTIPLANLWDDIDGDLAVRPEVIVNLEAAQIRRASGQCGIPAAEVAKQFGLEWHEPPT